MIFENGRPKDGNDWSNYVRREIEIEPTLNTREAALKADEILKQRELKQRGI